MNEIVYNNFDVQSNKFGKLSMEVSKGENRSDSIVFKIFRHQVWRPIVLKPKFCVKFMLLRPKIEFMQS